MPLVSFDGILPALQESVFVAPDAWLTGRVTAGAESSFFFGAVARGDINPIVVGMRTNVQDHAMLHTSHGLGPCRIGNDVTVGHRAILHGCTVQDRCIIGMGAILLDGAEIGEDCIVGAHSLVTMNMRIPPRSMVYGSPAKVVRTLSAEELAGILASARSYQEVSREYSRQFSAG